MSVQRRFARASGLSVLILLACSEAAPRPLEPESGSAETGGRPAFLVSEPIRTSVASGASGAADGPGVVYVSVSPGSLVGALTVQLRNSTANGTLTTAASIIDGGFDPIPVLASIGDKLELIVRNADGTVASREMTVPPHRPPMVVRTDPPAGRTDVALNSRPRVIFSEPIDAQTLTTRSVQLLQGSSSVGGRVAAVPGSAFEAEFIPDSDLNPDVTYELRVSTDIRDREGEALPAELRVSFTTGQTIALSARVVSVLVSPGAISTSRLGETFVFMATASDSAGNELVGRSVSWTSGAPAVVSISSDGIATTAGAGVAKIRATIDGVYNEAVVVVSPPPPSSPVVSISIHPSSATVQQGASFQFFPLAITADGHSTTDGLTWSSSDPAIATVASAEWRTGMVRGVTAGAVVITATIDTFKARVPVTVVPVPPAPAGLEFASVSAGWRHTCGLTTGADAYCWGDNAYGQLGDGSTTASAVPVAVAGGLKFASISAGEAQTCAVTPAGAAYCWGSFSGLGTGTKAQLTWCVRDHDCTPTPVPVAGGLVFSSVSAGQWHSCGVTLAGKGYCWGWWTEDGALGVDPDCIHAGCGETPEPVAGDLTFASINAGDSRHTCGVTTAGAGYCWGYNTFGELGIGTRIGDGFGHCVTDGCVTTGPDTCADVDWGWWTACSYTPAAVAGGLTFRSVIPGSVDACGLTTTGDAYCWGQGYDGRLGNGMNTDQSTPARVIGGLEFASLSNGNGNFACGVTPSGSVYCWGQSPNTLTGSNNAGAGAPPAGLAFESVSVGGSDYSQLRRGPSAHACGLTTAGDLVCWGSNEYGQLGTGEFSSYSAATGVVGQSPTGPARARHP
jgi:alpha-tubulin suppressor-like RCC1 family protein